MTPRVLLLSRGYFVSPVLLMPERETTSLLAKTTFQQRLSLPDVEGGIGEN